ncbi:hypothetical protein E2C01_038751 [Portunus trituberculatus]|uniref:PiggyBac transposable element-derived protein domain-containing protein n=1 Tax=Portunus trituberculatus TaxID=210409 RepID=A0A5B7FHZ1_PORTR|nr:hypothetical protein [Portunus trituberculatus]
MERENILDFDHILAGYLTDELSDLESDGAWLSIDEEDESREDSKSSGDYEPIVDPPAQQQRKWTHAGEVAGVRRNCCTSPFILEQFVFHSTLSGITDACTVTNHSNELDFLLQFFDNDLVDVIVVETNRYGHCLRR